jgi:hypothetical protein
MNVNFLGRIKHFKIENILSLNNAMLKIKNAMKKKYIPSTFRYILILLVSIISSLAGFAQVTPVSADPALGSFDITDFADVSLNANALSLNSIYKVKLDVFNLSLSTPIPDNTVRVDIGLGTKFVLNPAYTVNAATLNAYLASAPLSSYFTFTYITGGSQPIIRCTLTSELPKDFNDIFVFEVKANVQGTSNVTSNFFITNNNPLFTLADDNSGNNTASLQYTITSVVPVTISDFTASNKDCHINVNWSVSQETNVSKYDIELSKDGTNFAKIGSLKAENKNIYDTSIAIFDQIKSPNLFVRLKSVDIDGTFKYSPIVLFDGSCKSKLQQEVYCYPNPVRKEKTITIASKDLLFSGNYLVSLMDVSGKFYTQKQLKLDSLYSFKLPISNELAAGNYFIILQKEDKSENVILRFIKED